MEDKNISSPEADGKVGGKRSRRKATPEVVVDSTPVADAVIPAEPDHRIGRLSPIIKVALIEIYNSLGSRRVDMATVCDLTADEVDHAVVFATNSPHYGGTHRGRKILERLNAELNP